MRRFYNNGTSFVEALTKGAANLTPGGAIANVVKKVIKSKEDKKSRNPNPKTPTMMGTNKDAEKNISTSSERRDNNTFSKEKINKFFEDKKNKKVTKTAKNLSELKSGKIKTLPISSEQQNNKGKKKLQSAFNKG